MGHVGLGPCSGLPHHCWLDHLAGLYIQHAGQGLWGQPKYIFFLTLKRCSGLHSFTAYASSSTLLSTSNVLKSISSPLLARSTVGSYAASKGFDDHSK